ncbi:hypothetical protein KQI33_00740 [Enterococcus devriesei]|uniref:hypothetical protein n=1 Tax=Enterococcus devriesei TaxID=319970 RepID=UPI001C12359F|nr:hypothetical protein [Enterococcus devriesei]MBU5363899.1 hypothetical protein [Enterococcus devriesei]
MAKVTTYFISLSCFLSLIITLLMSSNFANGYEGMIVLPLVYLILFFLFFLKFVGNTSNPYSLYGVLVMQWIRFVLMPPICALAGMRAGSEGNFISPTPDSLRLGILFMILEFLGVSIFCTIFFRKAKSKKESLIHREQDYYISGNKAIYVFFFIFTGCIYYLFGRNKGILNFLVIRLGTGERIGDTDSFLLLAIRQLILVSIMLLVVVITKYASQKFYSTNNKIYYYCAISVSLINISIIVGERRTAQVYAALCSIWLLVRLFPTFKKQTITYIITGAGVVLFFMSVYKFFGAFQYASYGEALTQSTLDVGVISGILQAYFFGPQNIAISIEFFNNFNMDLIQMFFDIFRSFFGISYLFRGLSDVTSVFFNTYIYGTQRDTGQILSSVAYSYGYLGPIFLPVFACINLTITLFFEKILTRIKSLEVIYIVLYIIVRFSTNLFSNTPGLLSSASMFAMSSFFIIVIASVFGNKNKLKKQKSQRTHFSKIS